MRSLFILAFLLLTTHFLLIIPAQAQSSPIIIDHTSVALFDQIPTTYLNAAKNLKSLYLHRSVGGTILTGLNCLAGNNDNRAFCAGISNPDYQFNPANWVWLDHPSAGCDEKVQNLVDAVPSHPGYDVYQQKYCFFEGLDSLSSACCNAATYGTTQYTNAFNTHWAYYTNAMETLQANYPNKIFVHWTTPYVTQSSDHCANDWNNRLRNYVHTNGGILYDIGDIETFNPQNQITLVNNLEATFPHYCGEYKNNPDAIACHPDFPFSDEGLPDGGNVRLAKAWWVLMARLAGWNPGSNPTSPPPPPTYDYIDLLNVIRNYGQTIAGNSINIFDFNTIISHL